MKHADFHLWNCMFTIPTPQAGPVTIEVVATPEAPVQPSIAFRKIPRTAGYDSILPTQNDADAGPFKGYPCSAIVAWTDH